MNSILVSFLFASVAAAQVVPGYAIIELAGQPAAARVGLASGLRGSLNRRATLDRSRAPVLREQAGVRRQVAALGGTVAAELTVLVNALVVEGDIAPETLAALPGVRAVHPVRWIEPALDHAIRLQQVIAAWNWVGHERAGEGIKIAIVDTGIDIRHPAFRDPSMAIPDGYPLVNEPGDLPFTSNKVIVARNYERMFSLLEAPSLEDRGGHGTMVAACAAAVRHSAPAGEVSGVAPKAWLGAYKVFPGRGRTLTRDDVMLKAMEDAILDGMDVINLSIGGLPAVGASTDIFGTVHQRAASLGVVVVRSSGNDGPSIATTGDGGKADEYALTAGASENDRNFSATATFAGKDYRAIAGSGPAPAAPVRGPLKDVASLDPSGLLCGALPAGSLNGMIALILRGTCTFTVKLDFAEKAGAIGALVYTHTASPDPIAMSVTDVRLPAMMVSNADGEAIKRQLGAGAPAEAILDFRTRPLPRPDNAVASFSSRGPTPEYAIKPDLVAVGNDIYTALSGYVTGNAPGSYGVTSGTSFSSPTVAGAAAVVMAARPGLSVAQYRSLLVNTATVIRDNAGQPLPVQNMGAGRLNLEAAVRGTAAAYPVSASFGPGNGTIDAVRRIVVTNLGRYRDTFTAAVQPHAPGPAPTVTPSSAEIGPGASAAFNVRFTANGLAPVAHEGFIEFRGSTSESAIHVPYWHGVASSTPRSITLLDSWDSGRTNVEIRGAIYFRVNDAAGIAMMSPTPVVEVQEGGGSVSRVYSVHSTYPGVFAADVRLGPNTGASANIFRIKAGDITQTVTIAGEP